MERVEFISHGGEKVLMIDFTGCAPDEVIEFTNKAREVIAGQARKSVLVVADFAGAKLNRDAVTRLKEVTALDVPFVRRAAWVGTEISLPEQWFRAIETFSTREFVRFDTRQEALDWIVTAEEQSRIA